YCITDKSTPNVSASKRKLELIASLDIPWKDIQSQNEYCIIDKSKFICLFRGMQCKVCKSEDISISFGKNRGFCEIIIVTCDTCQEILNSTETSDYSKTSKTVKSRPYDVNRRVAESFISMGDSYSKIEQFGM